MERPHSIVFAILPDEECRSRVADLMSLLRTDHRVIGAPVPPEFLYVSVQYVGSAEALRSLEAARRLAASLDQPSFRIEFDRVITFHPTGVSPVAITGQEGTADLLTLREQIGEVLGHFVGSGYKPHLTFMHTLGRGISDLMIEPISWVAHELVLLQVPFREDHFTELERFPLRGD